MRVLLLVSLMASMVLCVFTLLDRNGWKHRQKLHNDVLAVQQLNTERTQRAESLRRQIDALRSRPDVQERVIRDELGYVRPGDIILDFGASGSR